MNACNDYPTLFDDLVKDRPLPRYDEWQYIAEDPSIIWSGPMAVLHLYQDYVNDTSKVTEPFAVDPDAGNFVLSLSGNGNPQRPFPEVTFITPCINESDHPTSIGTVQYGDGPQWLAWLVDSIAQSPYWGHTAILVSWDDWGGFYDHYNNNKYLGNPWPLHPPTDKDPYGPGGPAGYNSSADANSWGIRVPLMVISPWVKSAGYVDYNDTFSQGAITTFIEQAFAGENTFEGALHGDDWTNWLLKTDLTTMFQNTQALGFTNVPNNFATPSPGYGCPIQSRR